MSIQERRERERAEREKLIIAAARELAETEGWDAVTTRRLAERVEYSQPVLYSHFDGKDAIKTAVAVEGFAELATGLAAARAAAPDPARALAAVSDAYMDFARRQPGPLRRDVQPDRGPAVRDRRRAARPARRLR